MPILMVLGEQVTSRPYPQHSSFPVKVPARKMQNLNNPTGKLSTSFRDQILGTRVEAEHSRSDNWSRLSKFRRSGKGKSNY